VDVWELEGREMGMRGYVRGICAGTDGFGDESEGKVGWERCYLGLRGVVSMIVIIALRE